MSQERAPHLAAAAAPTAAAASGSDGTPNCCADCDDRGAHAEQHELVVHPPHVEATGSHSDSSKEISFSAHMRAASLATAAFSSSDTTVSLW